MKILQIISKNCKVLFRTKVSLLILLLSPLLVILLLGILFNNQNLYNINVGYTIEKENDFNSQYIEVLKANFNLIEYENSKNCIEGIERGMSHVCIFFTGDNSTSRLVLKMDSSKNNIKNIVEKLVLGTLNSKTKNIQINKTDSLVQTLFISEENSKSDVKELNNLTLQIDNLKKSFSSLSSQTKRIKASFEIDDLNLEDFEKDTDNIAENIDGFLNTGYTQIDEMKSELDTISDSLDNANFSSEDDEDNAKKSIDTIEKELEDLRSNIYALKKESDLDTFSSDMSDLITDLEDTDKILSSSIIELEKVKNDIEDVNRVLKNSTTEMLASNSELVNSIDNLKIKDSQSVLSPYEVEIEDAIPTTKNHLGNIFPSILVSLIFVISIFLSANFVLFEKESEASFRNFLVQTRSSTFFFANFITLFLIVFIQLSIILSVYYFMFIRSFGAETLLIMLISIPIIMLFVLIGMIIGYLSVNQTTNIVLSFVFIFIILALSGLMIPLEILSQKMINLMQYNPYLIAAGVFRKFILFKSAISDLYFEFLILSIYIILLMIIALIFSSLSMKGTVFRVYALFLKKSKKSKFYILFRKVFVIRKNHKG